MAGSPRRARRVAAGFVAGVLAFVLVPLVAPVSVLPAGAAEAFTLTVEDGELSLRDTEEPQILESPTTISGTNDGGVLKDITFSTPPINFILEVTDPVTTTAEIDAVFSQAGAINGTIDPDGNVVITLRLTVDLDIHVELLNNTFECQVTPVVVTLRSEAPYDGSGILSAEFSLPSTPTTDTCTPLISGAANAALLGGGHSLRLPVSGELTRPAHPGEPTTTSLAVSPASSVMGDPVTLTATVAKGAGATGTEAITGAVDFLDRGQVIGTADLDEDGKAELTIDTLGAGDRQLQAQYRGIPEVWAPSTSDVVEYRVNATPFLSTVVPATVRSGGPPADLAVTVENTGLGASLEDVRVDVSIRRGGGSGSIGPSGGVPRITLTHVDGETETPIDLAGTGTLTGTIGDLTGWDLAPGSSRTDDLRLAVSDNTNHGPLNITFSLVRVTPGTGEEILATLTTGTDQIIITKDTRTATTVTAGDIFFGDPAIVPAVVRQGGYLNVNFLAVVQSGSQVSPTGMFEFFINGQRVAARQTNESGNPPYAQVLPVPPGSVTYIVQVSPDVAIGGQQVTVRYSGDALFAPSQESWPVQIAPAAGASYECAWTGLFQYRSFVNLQATAALPALAAAGQVDITDLQLQILASRTSTGISGYTFIGEFPSSATTFLSPGGEATSNEGTRANSSPMTTTSGSPDHLIAFADGTGQIELSGEPGEQVPVTIDQITINQTNDSINFTVTCVPVDAPVKLGDITLAATTLAADADVVETGHPVALTAAALPAGAGAVEFRDGAESIGVVPTVDGTAVHLADELAPGVHELTATFHGGVGVPKTTSEPVTVRVATCAAATGEGNEAAVRLMYLEILRRCPDEAGLAFWTERLDAGATTREQITVQLAGSLEARKVYVDDAFRQMLGRPAEAAGKDFWAPRLATGRYDALLGDLAASGEFRRLAGGTDAGVVQRIYERIIGRSAESTGLTYWTGFMGDHGVSRLVRVLYNLPEPLAATVGNAYRDLVGRAPTGEEAAAGAELLKTTGNRGRLDGAIIATDDFDTRAQGIPELT